MDQLARFLIPATFAIFLLWRWWKFRAVRRQFPRYLAVGAQIVDVRTRGEFSAAHLPGSINIPLDELASRVESLNRDRPVLVCCASGSRSAIAARVLKKRGFKEAVNAGSWSRLRGLGDDSKGVSN